MAGLGHSALGIGRRANERVHRDGRLGIAAEIHDAEEAMKGRQLAGRGRGTSAVAGHVLWGADYWGFVYHALC